MSALLADRSYWKWIVWSKLCVKVRTNGQGTTHKKAGMPNWKELKSVEVHRFSAANAQASQELFKNNLQFIAVAVFFNTKASGCQTLGKTLFSFPKEKKKLKKVTNQNGYSYSTRKSRTKISQCTQFRPPNDETTENFQTLFHTFSNNRRYAKTWDGARMQKNVVRKLSTWRNLRLVVPIPLPLPHCFIFVPQVSHCVHCPLVPDLSCTVEWSLKQYANFVLSLGLSNPTWYCIKLQKWPTNIIFIGITQVYELAFDCCLTLYAI